MNILFIDINEKLNEIEADITANQSEIFNRYTYYTTKYKGDLLNDVNVGLFINDGNIPTVQIFVRNKTGCIRKHIQFTNDYRKIKDIKILNYITHEQNNSTN